MSYQTYKNDEYLYEKLIIGCLLQKNTLFESTYVEAKHFFHESNRKLFNHFQALYKKKNTFGFTDIATSVELTDYCFMCTELVTSIHQYDNYQYQLIEQYKKKNLVLLLEKITEGGEDINEVLNDITSLLLEEGKVNEKSFDGQQLFNLISSKADLIKFFRFRNLYSKLSIPENTVNIIAARTSKGKSAFALNLLNDLSRNYKCLYFNMEMTEKEVYQRLVGIETGIAINKYSELEENSIEYHQVLKECNRIAIDLKGRIKVINGSKTVNQIRNIIIRQSRNEPHIIVFIDYIGYVSNNKHQSDKERIGEALRSIQELSKDYPVTFFVLAQLNRDAAEDDPKMEQLKDSGELEQTAHCILLLHDVTDDIAQKIRDYKVIVPKNRSGEIGNIYMNFNKSTQQFKEK